MGIEIWEEQREAGRTSDVRWEGCRGVSYVPGFFVGATSWEVVKAERDGDPDTVR